MEDCGRPWSFMPVPPPGFGLGLKVRDSMGRALATESIAAMLKRDMGL